MSKTFPLSFPCHLPFFKVSRLAMTYDKVGGNGGGTSSGLDGSRGDDDDLTPHRHREGDSVEYDSNEDINAALQLSFEDSPDHTLRSSPEECPRRTGGTAMSAMVHRHQPHTPLPSNAGEGGGYNTTAQSRHVHRDTAPYPYGMPAYQPYHHPAMGYPQHYPPTSSSHHQGVSYHGYPPPPPPGCYPAHQWPTTAPPPPPAGPAGQHPGYYNMYPPHHPQYQQPRQPEVEREREYVPPPTPETPTSAARTPSRTTPAKRKGLRNIDINATIATAEMPYDDMDEMIGGPISPPSSKKKRDAGVAGGTGYSASTEAWGAPQSENTRGAIVSYSPSRAYFFLLDVAPPPPPAPPVGLYRLCGVPRVHFFHLTSMFI
jgi:hypothetical protein